MEEVAGSNPARSTKNMKSYNPRQIEPKWQKYWEENKLFEAVDFDEKPKKYVLDMFPYPSAAGLHVGHPEGYTATDIYCRYLRMKGFNVMHPMGWDAFGLPAENYAIKTGTHPQKTTQENINIFRRQIMSLGFSYDWSREIDTTDPDYYKWTQWIFVQLFKAGLAYEATAPINFCPSCKTGLANEEVSNGQCERCGSQVERKTIRQWILKITKYADRLLKDLDKLDWPEPIKLMQKNWIGRSEGAKIEFRIRNEESRIKVFTTRADTLFGCTYLVLAPESKLVDELRDKISNSDEIQEYIQKVASKSDLERTELQKEKSGIEVKGVKAINPINNEEIPIWVADYVLAEYGTGAVMAVPAHDERDFEFAKKYGLDIKFVIFPKDGQLNENEAFVQYGILKNSGEFNGQKSDEAKKNIIEKLKAENLGDFTINYKLRDWIFSRQRYWGEPIPIVHCEKCGPVAVDEKDLPVKLPEVKNYEPSGTGDSPLVGIVDWVKTTCPKCAGPAKRETNTMPQWAGSCWYYLRFIDPQNKKMFVDAEKEKYWMPIDLYVGGAEHAVLHLLYARFWHKFLYDRGLVSTDEPFLKLKNQGMILAEDGHKMSKSLGNVINPDDIVMKYGADTLRLYEMFMGPFEMVKKWDTKSIEGVSRFLKKVYAISQSDFLNQTKPDSIANETIKRVTADIENFRFNTAISALMVFANKLSLRKPTKKELEILIMLVSPFAPHLAEEIWQNLGHKQSVCLEKWPDTDKSVLRNGKVTIVIQVNGRKRLAIKEIFGISKDQLIEKITKYDRIAKDLENQKKIVYVQGKIINIVTQ